MSRGWLPLSVPIDVYLFMMVIFLHPDVDIYLHVHLRPVDVLGICDSLRRGMVGYVPQYPLSRCLFVF